MLTFSFFAAVFFTISWVIYIGTYIYARIGNLPPATVGLTDMTVYTALLIIPVFAVWAVWNGFYRFRHERTLQRQFKNIDAQLKQNQEYFEIIARLLYQGQQSNQNHFILNQTELFVNELNGLIADMLQRYNFISDSETAKLWTTAEKGNRWGFAKALISLKNNSADFGDRLYQTAIRENLLRGTINEFCARYCRLLDMLKTHDTEKIFLNIIETGALGKAFAILAPISELIEFEAETPDISSDETTPGFFSEPQSLPEGAARDEEKDDAKEHSDTKSKDIEPFFDNEENEDISMNYSPEAVPEIKPQTKTETSAAKDEQTAESGIDKTDSLTEEINQMFAGAGVRGDDDDDSDDYWDDNENKKPKAKKFTFPKFSNLFKRKPAKEKNMFPEEEIDPLTLALERSFGKLADNNEPNPNSRLYKIMNAEENNDSENQDKKFAFVGTNETIMKLQQELEALKNDNPKDGKKQDADSENL